MVDPKKDSERIYGQERWCVCLPSWEKSSSHRPSLVYEWEEGFRNSQRWSGHGKRA